MPFIVNSSSFFYFFAVISELLLSSLPHFGQPDDEDFNPVIQPGLNLAVDYPVIFIRDTGVETTVHFLVNVV
jgi:hypothetical protein